MGGGSGIFSMGTYVYTIQLPPLTLEARADTCLDILLDDE